MTVVAQVNIDTRGTWQCQGKDIYQVKKGKRVLQKSSKVISSQQAVIRSLKSALKKAAKNKKPKIQTQLTAASALLSRFRICIKGQLLPTPTPIPTPTNFSVVTPITTGAHHACAITPSPDGSIYCWGRNDFGQLGTGNTQNSSLPVKVQSISQAVAVAAGEYHTCAVLVTGQVNCWGSGFFGQLVNGSNNSTSNIPLVIPNLTDAVDIASGYDHTCVLTNSGGLKCWGRNDSGQLGTGSTSSPLGVVTPTGFSNGVSSFGLGDFHTCVVNSAGALFCFGWNNDGQLGLGDFSQRSLPTAVGSPLNSGVTNVGGGYNMTCARKNDGTAYCMGRNNLFQLSKATPTSSNLPLLGDVSGLFGKITMSRASGYAAKNDGSLGSWGGNDKGQLGNGSTSGSFVSQTVTGLSTGAIKNFSSKNLFACVVLEGGAVNCVGDNTYGQLGNGTTNPTGVGSPVLVSGLTAAN